MGAETNAVRAQARARGLIEALHLLGDLLPLQHPERFDELEGDATRKAGNVLGLAERDQWPQQFLDMGLQPEREPRLDAIARRARQLLVGEDAKARLQGTL